MHNWCLAEAVIDLIDQTVPTPDPADVCGGGVVADGLGVLGSWFDTLVSDRKPSELHLIPSKLELVSGEYQAMLITVAQDAADPCEGLLH
jgi:hypothetical protein